MLRNLRRGGIYSAINVGGLAIGMAAAMLILAWIHHEWSYDRFHSKGKQLYVAYNREKVDGKVQCWDWNPNLLGPALKADYPDVAGMSRLSYQTLLCTNGDTKLKITTGCVDHNFLTMFDFPLLKGNRDIALNDPFSIILTEQAAIRLFGDEDPTGKTLLIESQPVTVTGVMKNMPGNTQFRNLEALTPISINKDNESWTSSTLQTFVELHPQARLDHVNESIRGIIKAYANNPERAEVFLYPLNRQHLYSRFDNGAPAGGMINSLRMFGLVAGLILLIACINFMNLCTARSAKRAKEVGVRKVMGGNRLSLVRLFLGESMLVSFIAGAMALMLALMILPVFSTFMGRSLMMDLTDIRFWLAWAGFIMITGLLAGSYPAFYLSSFLPVKILKGLFRDGKSTVSSRKVLVVVQFTIACAFIMFTIVINRQIRHVQNRESGYSREHLIYTSMEGDMAKNYELIRHDLLTSGTAVSVTKNASPMTQGFARVWTINWQGKDPETTVTFDLFFTDANWTKTAGTTIVEGRDIDIYTYPTDSTAMLLNESAVKAMKLEHPTGETVTTQGKEWHVVGVVKDFILKSPSNPVEPMIIGGPAGWFTTIHIKLNSNNSVSDNLAGAEQIFKQYNPSHPFDYHFVDTEYARKFQEGETMRSLSTGFAGLTIFISCMGLFALVAYMAETRRKEIGIRKVLGASVSSIMLLLSK